MRTEPRLLASSTVSPFAIPSMMSFLRFAARALSSSDSSNPETSFTASSIRSMRFGNASLKRPVILTETSNLGLPSSDSGTTSRPVTWPPIWDQTGLTPISQRI